MEIFFFFFFKYYHVWLFFGLDLYDFEYIYKF